MKTPLNVHLMREDTTYDQIFTDEWRPGGLNSKVKERYPAKHFSPGYWCRLVLKPIQQNKVSWANFVQAPFDLQDHEVTNQSVSAILVIRISERFFAIPFGHGHHGIDNDRVCHDFGFRVALNRCDPDRIKGISSRTVDSNPLHQSRLATEASFFNSLRVDLDQEWVRSIEGEAENMGFVRGSHSAKVQWNGMIEDLGDLCIELLADSERADYRTRFPDIDQIRPVEDSALLKRLDEVLRERLNDPYREPLTLSYLKSYSPEEPSYIRYRFFSGHQRLEFDDLTIKGLADFLTSNPKIDPFDVKIMAFDEDGSEGRRERLYKCLVTEVRLEGIHYLFLEGTWLRVSRTLFQKVKNGLARIPDITDDFSLPRWEPGESEGDYNARVAMERGWILVDQKLAHYQDNQKVEPCDILAPPTALPGSKLADVSGSILIAVKMASSSAVLSHLFAQGSVTASLLRDDEQRFREHLDALCDNAGLPEGFQPDGATIVYAIAMEKGHTIDSIFLFSQLNLVEHAKRIRNSNFRCAICLIEKTPSLTSKA